MSVITDPLATPPRVAFAVGRSVGSAPVRNRVRRRLRALARDHADQLAPGWYLIGADAGLARARFAEAEAQFGRLLAAAFARDVSPGSRTEESS
jgi:ribonuclease P protein component